MLVRKNTAASTAVLRLRKLAEPEAPNRLPEAPLPNAAPISAPLPCWSSTKPITPAAATTCTTRIKPSIIVSSMCSRTADRDELGRDQRCAADQAAVDIRHAEQLWRVGGLDAPAIQDS